MIRLYCFDRCDDPSNSLILVKYCILSEKTWKRLPSGIFLVVWNCCITLSYLKLCCLFVCFVKYLNFFFTWFWIVTIGTIYIKWKKKKRKSGKKRKKSIRRKKSYKFTLTECLKLFRSIGSIGWCSSTDDQHLQSVSERCRSTAGRNQPGSDQIRRGGVPFREKDCRTDTQYGGHNQSCQKHTDPQRGRSPAAIVFRMTSALFSPSQLMLIGRVLTSWKLSQNWLTWSRFLPFSFFLSNFLDSVAGDITSHLSDDGFRWLNRTIDHFTGLPERHLLHRLILWPKVRLSWLLIGLIQHWLGECIETCDIKALNVSIRKIQLFI